MYYHIVKLKNHLKARLWNHTVVYKLCSAGYQVIRNVYCRFHAPYTRNADDLEDSIFRYEYELEMCSRYPRELLDMAWNTYQPVSVLDIGCGTGTSLAYFQQKGARIRGIEGSDLAISKSAVKTYIVAHNLQAPIDLGERFDLVWSYEVVEHIKPDYADILVQTLVTHASRILLLSAAVPGQGGLGHFNEQPPAYWIQKIEPFGFRFDEAMSRKFQQCKDGENILVFERA